MTTANAGYHSYRLEEGHGLARNPLKAVIAPRPIAWVSTLSAEGVGNLAPYSFFNMINDAPPMIMFSSVGYKDTVRNIAETGEFALSTVSSILAGAMNVTSGAFAPDVDEFDTAGLLRFPSTVIGPPGVAGSPAILECRSIEVKQLQGRDGQMIQTWMVIGEIVAVHLDRNCLEERLFRTELATPQLRAGYADEYWSIDAAAKFLMRR